jgi:hypothetical protein
MYYLIKHLEYFIEINYVLLGLEIIILNKLVNLLLIKSNYKEFHKRF